MADIEPFHQAKVFQVQDDIDPTGQHLAQTSFAVAAVGRTGQGQQAIEGIAGTFGMGRGQAAVARIGCADEFHRLITHNFSDTIAIKRHGQSISHQVLQGHRPATFMAALDALNQAVGLLWINFTVAFGNQDAFQAGHGLDNGPQQGCFARSPFAANQDRLVALAQTGQGRCQIQWKHAQSSQF